VLFPLLALSLIVCESDSTIASAADSSQIASDGRKDTSGSYTVFCDRLADGSLGPEMVWIPAGSFRMSDVQGGGRPDEKPVHRVSVERFAVGKYEVTVGEFRRFVEATGYETDAEKHGSCYGYSKGWVLVKGVNWRDPGFPQSDRHPVACVSWNDGVAYAKWLSEQTGKTYRLPTEAEWEYATRAGTETARYWGNDPDKACDYANAADQTAKQKHPEWAIHNCTDGYVYTAPVGTFAPNKFGLYDTLGNLWEWTCSKYESRYQGQELRCVDSIQRDQDLSARGGSWFDGTMRTRSAGRGKAKPANRYTDVGLRMARR